LSAISQKRPVNQEEKVTVFPQIIAGGAQKGGDYWTEAIISNIAHWKSCPKYFVSFFHI